MTANSSEPILLRNARLVLPERVSDAASVLIENGRLSIIHEGDHAFPRREMQTIDLDGLTVFPGFVDIHIHGAVGIDTMDASIEGLHSIARYLAENGTTSWVPTLVPASTETYTRAASAIDQLIHEQDELPPAARACGIHYEGPFVNSAQCGALHAEHFRAYRSSADLDDLSILTAANATHLMTVAPEIDGGVELVRDLVGRRWLVSIGHTRASVEVLDRAFEAGARHMTHFLNAMAPLHHRAPGPIGWGLANDEVTCDVIADGVHVDPLMLKLILRCKSVSRVSLISDAVAPAGLGDGEYGIWGETITVEKGRTRNSRGSIAGSVITVSDAVRLMLSLGVSAVGVGQMASTNPARLLGIDSECGSIEEGKRADLVALDDEGRVRLTMVGGRVVVEKL